MHAYEFVQISGFTMNDDVYFYAINDATEAINNVTMTIKIIDWRGKVLRTEERVVDFPALAAVKLFEPISIEKFLGMQCE